MEIGTNTPDKLLAGALHVVTGAVTIAASQDLKRGAVLGIITASGQAKLVDSAATDGSQTAKVVLLDAVKTEAAETKPAPVAKTGEFNSLALTVGGTDTISDHLDSLGRLAGNAGIFVSTNQAAIN